jgi:hypothetical protein
MNTFIENERPEPMTDKQLIGWLIKGTEGKSIAWQNLPEIIDLSALLLPKIKLVWEASANDPELKERALTSTTQGDRRLHFAPTLLIGERDKVFTPRVTTPGVTGIPLGIHSHAFHNTPPSIPDILNLTNGTRSPQAEIVTTATCDFLLLRTDRTVTVGNIPEMTRKLQTLEETQLNQLSLTLIQENMSDLPEATNTQDRVNQLLTQQSHNRLTMNIKTCAFAVEQCEYLGIALYISPQKNGLFSRVNTSTGLDGYAHGLTDLIATDLDRKIRKHQRELNPELGKITLDRLGDELYRLALEKAEAFFGSTEIHKVVPGGFIAVIEAFNRKNAANLTVEETIIWILEKGEFDPMDGAPMVSIATIVGITEFLVESGVLDSLAD